MQINEIDRQEFMEFFRAEDFHEKMTVDDCLEIFCNVLHGSSDITKGLLIDLCCNYGVALLTVMEQPDIRDWYFTFGTNHEHPKNYVKINGTCDEARNVMFKNFGNKWCMQYKDFKSVNAEKRGLLELTIPLERG